MTTKKVTVIETNEVNILAKDLKGVFALLNRDTLRDIAKRNGVSIAPLKHDLIGRLTKSGKVISVSIG